MSEMDFAGYPANAPVDAFFKAPEHTIFHRQMAHQKIYPKDYPFLVFLEGTSSISAHFLSSHRGRKRG
jgi:hypothetical protein